MYSTICVECFNDIPSAYGDCPYCKIAADQQTRLIVQGDESEAVWGIHREDYPFPHEFINRKRTSAVLSLLLGAALSALILVCSMPTPPVSAVNPQDWPSWVFTDEQLEQAPKWSSENEVTLKEANSDLLQRRTTRR